MIPIFCRLRAANSARLSHGSRRLQICRSPSIFVERQKYHRRVLTVGHKCGILMLALIRRCGGMVDTGDLKSPGSNTVPVRVRSPAPSGKTIYRGVEQLVARRAHNPEVGGPSPPSATKQEVNPNGWPLIVFPPHVASHHIQQPLTNLFKYRNS